MDSSVEKKIPISTWTVMFRCRLLSAVPISTCHLNSSFLIWKVSFKFRFQGFFPSIFGVRQFYYSGPRHDSFCVYSLYRVSYICNSFTKFDQIWAIIFIISLVHSPSLLFQHSNYLHLIIFYIFSYGYRLLVTVFNSFSLLSSDWMIGLVHIFKWADFHCHSHCPGHPFLCFYFRY